MTSHGSVIRCLVCAKDSISLLPVYLPQTLSQFYANLSHCESPKFPWEDIEVESGKSLDHHCKSSKLQSLQRTVDSITERVHAWIAYLKANPSV